MARINLEQFRKEILADTGGQLSRAAYALANERFQENKEQLMEDFENHEVTQEIEAGPEPEESDLIDDKGRANLYSFIGFEGDEGRDELEDIRTILEQDITIKQSPNKGDAKWQFGIFIPSDDDLENVTPMPWGTSRSWLRAIERGISGINHYLYRLESGRSEGGIQVKGDYRHGQARFKPRGYVFALLTKFKNQFK